MAGKPSHGRLLHFGHQVHQLPAAVNAHILDVPQRRLGEAEFGASTVDRGGQARLAGQRAALGAHHAEHGKSAIFTSQPRQQSGTQERRLSAARRTQHHENRCQAGKPHSAHRIHASHDLGVTPEKDTGIDGFKRLPTSVWRTIGVRRWWPDIRLSADPRSANRVTQSVQSSAGKGHRRPRTHDDARRRAVAE
nr:MULTISPECIES: hypothetical protein [Mycobacterium]